VHFCVLRKPEMVRAATRFPCLQPKTALADTPGSNFMQQCMDALQQQRLDLFAGLLLQHLETVVAQCDAAGVGCYSMPRSIPEPSEITLLVLFFMLGLC
jgi:hypothetical protein